MSNRYGASVRVGAAPAAGAAFAEFRLPAATRRAYVEEITVSLAAATATSVGLVRATAVGTGALTLGQAEDPGNAVTSNGGLATATLGTFTAANAMRRVTLSPAIGALLSFSWGASDRLIVPAGTAMLLVNTGAAAGAAAIDVHVVWSE